MLLLFFSKFPRAYLLGAEQDLEGYINYLPNYLDTDMGKASMHIRADIQNPKLLTCDFFFALNSSFRPHPS